MISVALCFIIWIHKKSTHTL